MATTQQYSLRWNNYFRHLTYAMENHRQNDDFVDVSLFCDGRKIKAHKVILSSCSSYFKEIFKENPHPHPVIIFKFIKYEDLNSIIEFMYQGEVNVQQEALQSFLQTAELLAVQGLTAEEKEKQKPPELPIIDQQKLIKTIPSTIRAINEPIGIAVTQQSSTTQTIEIPTATILQPQSTQTLQQATHHQIQHIQVQPQVQQQQQQQQHTTHPISLQHIQQQHTTQQQQQQQQVHQLQQQQVVHHHQQMNPGNTVTLTTPCTKKRKITFSDDDDNIYTAETVDYAVKDEQTIVKTSDMAFLRGSVKLDMPEYIVSEVDEQQLSDGTTQPTSQDGGGAQNVTQYTSEYEILTESEIDEKYPQAEAENAEISIEMSRLLNPTASTNTTAQQSTLDETDGTGATTIVTAVTKAESKSSSSGNFTCKVCKRKLQSINALRRHIASKHSKITSRVNECIVCKRSFKTKWSLSTHNSRFHRDMRLSRESMHIDMSEFSGTTTNNERLGSKIMVKGKMYM